MWKVNEVNPTIACIIASKEFLSHGGRMRNPEEPLVEEKLLAVQVDRGSYKSLERELHRGSTLELFRGSPTNCG